MTIKANLVSFAKDLQTLLNSYPEVFLSSTADGDLVAYDLGYLDSNAPIFKGDLMIHLPRAADLSTTKD